MGLLDTASACQDQRRQRRLLANRWQHTILLLKPTYSCLRVTERGPTGAPRVCCGEAFLSFLPGFQLSSSHGTVSCGAGPEAVLWTGAAAARTLRRQCA